MVSFFRPGLYLAALGAIALGGWIMAFGRGDAFGFPFELPHWLMFAGKDIAVGGIAVVVGLVVLAIAILTRPSEKEADEEPPHAGPLDPGA
jgi:hypothetical protein